MKQSDKEASQAADQISRETDELHQFVTFKLGGEDYGVYIEFVKEVTITPKISKIPKTPAFIRGVANVRGDLIAIIDLEERFGLKSPLNIGNDLAPELTSYTIVIDANTYTVGFIVKEMPKTLLLQESQIDNSADVIEKAKFKNKFITGLGKTGDGNIIVLLDILKVLSRKEVNQISRTRNK